MIKYFEYPLLEPYQIYPYLPMINELKVSQKAVNEGFLHNYLKYGTKILNKPSDQKGLNWSQKRYLFLVRTIPAFFQNPTLRRYLSLISWGYIPLFDINDLK